MPAFPRALVLRALLAPRTPAFLRALVLRALRAATDDSKQRA